MSQKPRLLILGVDQFHRNQLLKMTQEEGRQYDLDLSWQLSDFKNIHRREDIEKLAERLCKTIESASPPITGVVAYWDFPITLLQGYLNHKYGFFGPNLESTLKCEHKLWSRNEQKKVIPDNIPNFLKFDVYSDPIERLQKLKLPYWIKPIKSCASSLAFRVEKREQEEEIVDKIRNKIDSIATPVEFFTDQVDLPPSIPAHSGHFCLAEECMTGLQVTLEGFKWKGQVTCYAIFDDINDKYNRSFNSYQYPSRLPDRVKGRMYEIAIRVLDQLGFDNSPFNIEFFYNKKLDKIGLLEINPRISQSHTLPILWVDGFSNIRLSCDISAGIPPHIQYRQGDHTHAGKFFVRHYRDAKVEHVPSIDELKDLKERFPEVTVDLPVHEGQQLSELIDQDSYSYELALLYVNGDSRKEMLRKSREFQKELKSDFKLQEVGPNAHT